MTQGKIKINSKYFFAAVSYPLTIKRSPPGGKSKIPRDTTLTPAGENKLLVETPLKSKLINIKGFWNEQISVDALILEKIAKKLTESDFIELWTSDKNLFIKANAEFSIPFYS